MTGNTIEDRVRSILQDDEEDDVQWSKKQIARWINDRVDELVGLRSTALYDTDGSVITITRLNESIDDALATTLSIADKWAPVIAEGVTANCYRQQAGNRQNATRATEHEARFRQLAKAL